MAQGVRRRPIRQSRIAACPLKRASEVRQAYGSAVRSREDPVLGTVPCRGSQVVLKSSQDGDRQGNDAGSVCLGVGRPEVPAHLGLALFDEQLPEVCEVPTPQGQGFARAKPAVGEDEDKGRQCGSNAATSVSTWAAVK